MDQVMTAAAAFDRARQGDPSARDALVREWLPVVLRWCTSLGGPRVDPEEAAHDVLLVLVRNVGRVYDVNRLAPWLFGVTRRTVARHRRRAWFRRWVPGEPPDRADRAAGPARLYEISVTSQAVQACLDALPALDREILVLRLYEQRPDTEVAALLDVPVGTVKSRLHRARDRFMQEATARGLAPGGEGG